MISESGSWLPLWPTATSVARCTLIKLTGRGGALTPVRRPRMTECSICYDAYTGVQRRPVPCPSCDFAACARCVKTGLLSSLTEPACISCKAPWSRAFLDEHLTRTWISTVLHEHRGAVLYDRERAMLPATQAAVAVEKRKRDAAAALKALEPAILPLQNAATAANRAYNQAIDQHAQAYQDHRRGVPGATEENVQAALAQVHASERKFKVAHRTLRDFEKANKMHELHYMVRHGTPMLPDVIADTGRTPQELVDAGVYTWEQLEELGVPRPPERAKFVAACPAADCRGFLSNHYKCGVCAVQFCSKCREPKAVAGHECDPDLVATIAAIVADSRPCPSCGTAISRVSGCDQMWCTQCRTAFSYQTGQPVKGNIHNPHYFEQMAAVAAGAPEEQCGDYAVQQRLRRVLEIAQPRVSLGTDEWMTLIHMRHVYADILHRRLAEGGFPDPRTPLNNEDLRVQFLLGDFDDTAFKQKLSRRQRNRDFQLEVRAVLETAVSIFLDMFLAMPTTEDSTWKPAQYAAVLTEMGAKVELLLNTPLRDIATRYHLMVPYFEQHKEIPYHYSIGRYKPTHASLQRPAETDASASRAPQAEAAAAGGGR